VRGPFQGFLDLSLDVVVDDEDKQDCAATAVELNLGTGPFLEAPDLVIKVFEYRLAGQPGRLHFVISSTDLRLKDLPVLDGDLRMQDLNTDVADWVENQLRTLGSLACQPDVAEEDASAMLARVGYNLFEQLLPKTLQGMCWTFRERGIKPYFVHCRSGAPNSGYSLLAGASSWKPSNKGVLTSSM
jgi:hypothetical protein